MSVVVASVVGEPEGSVAVRLANGNARGAMNSGGGC